MFSQMWFFFLSTNFLILSLRRNAGFFSSKLDFFLDPSRETDLYRMIVHEAPNKAKEETL